MSASNPNSFLSKYSDIVLAIVVVFIVGMMIVPLPTLLLDVLLTLNISISVVLLLVSLYVPAALHLSVFPTLLLITTMFRLSLTISTTRLILLTGDPGEVVVAFGNFVVQGNFVVGAILFIILVIVNFIVISKGSERVAEVAARFTLDAMPGKQMSIDADLRAGSIDQDQGKKKRRDLERESQLFGAMDGAMKFVKGDAIASIIITVVNIVGGLIIGVTQKGMTAADAAQKYTLLTIGDGLVGMIPAILVSTCAGIIVTRVGGDEEGAHLGKDIGTQLTAYPKAIAIAAGMLIVLGLVPGLPKIPFFLLGAGAGFGAWTMLKKKRESEMVEEAGPAMESDLGTPMSSEPAPKEPMNPDSELFIPVVTPIVLEVSDALVPYVDSRQDNGKFLFELIPFMRDGLFIELGVRFPGVRARGNSSLPPGAYQVQINEVPVVTGQATLGHVLVNDTVDRLRLMNIQGFEAINPATRQPAAWVPEQHRDTLEAAGLTTWDVPGYIILHVAAVLRRNAREFVGVQETQTMLEQLEKAFPAIVKEVIPKVVNVLKLTDILQRLVEEEISIRDLRGILQALAEYGQVEADNVMLTEHVRASQRRYISHKYARGSGTLVVYLLDPNIEEAIRGSIKRTSAGAHLALEPELAQEIVQAVRSECGHLPPSAQRPVILTAMDIRRYVRKLLEYEFNPSFSVLSYQELSPELNIQPVARISTR
ncbi:type III secretion system export apparatus subunit SctV [Myxococcus sp. CA051A]|uniref:FHIPEP family type III secretion protein n=1 Tax=Myxococcus llanfairpwllgwyngyllgogerychwyrndrobwllllantysiliogogogochensis TaxID=2590453 RepID=A0A540WP48_9BACT|nr:MULTISPECIES: type III secretion system export apparatus subunit SctV [Myxococcus]NTX04275.1 type III secretion system export apparatus subunit SctV [Myxococcus sp. CA040A]NTX13105.1 type III secretion system export apparatus subunit SctV [Myxococcus sp. CA056]NTX36443.1 type III secretion system export apparatus subunit SctV [Myxococcus sp. CA033]NTX57806.1 type III secretion system export apparatus subunit SctV [Myxococcus sp. CA039A]NTX64751.1 type III secretion system export apparatus s